MTRTLTSKLRRAELAAALRLGHVAQVSSQPSMSFCAHNARLQPPAARNDRIERGAHKSGAPTGGWKPWLGFC
jgi:hypothetical protein